MSQCNFCNVRDARREAKRKGLVYVLVSEPTSGYRKAVRGYCVGQHETLKIGDESQEGGWYAEVPKSCTCDED